MMEVPREILRLEEESARVRDRVVSHPRAEQADGGYRRTVYLQQRLLHDLILEPRKAVCGG